MFGDYGKLTVDELWNLLSDLAIREATYQTMYDNGTEHLWSQKLHHFQYKMWNAQQQQLTAIVQCVKEIGETAFYGEPWEMAKKAIKAAKERDLQAVTQKITQRGVKFNDKWYFSEVLACRTGERVFVKCPNRNIVEIWSVNGECIDGIPIQRGKK